MESNGGKSGSGVEAEPGAVTGTAVIESVKHGFMQEARSIVRLQIEIEVAEMQLSSAKDAISLARERYKQCLSFLNDNVPGWRSMLTPSEIEALSEVHPF